MVDLVLRRGQKYSKIVLRNFEGAIFYEQPLTH